MASEDAGEKSQEPTPYRRQQAREEGNVVHSQELISVGLLLGVLLALLYSGSQLVDFLGELTASHLGGGAWLSTDSQTITSQWTQVAWGLGKTLLPILGLALLLAIGLNLLQTGFLFVPDKAFPDFNRVNPLSGFSRLFSTTSLVRLALGIIKVAIVGTVAYWHLSQHRDQILLLATLDLGPMALTAWSLCIWTCLKVGLALVLLAIADYGWQRWRYEQDLKMTSQEVREEMRNLQGDPQLIARRRQVQRQLAMHRLSSAVPKADVVITNPTELAVAIRYEPETMNAPEVVAKGAGVAAQRIRRLALEHGIPVIERKPLAQALYKDVELNRPIPSALYGGVAEILAYVYQLKGKGVPQPKQAG